MSLFEAKLLITITVDLSITSNLLYLEVSSTFVTKRVIITASICLMVQARKGSIMFDELSRKNFVQGFTAKRKRIFPKKMKTISRKESICRSQAQTSSLSQSNLELLQEVESKEFYGEVIVVTKTL